MLSRLITRLWRVRPLTSPFSSSGRENTAKQVEGAPMPSADNVVTCKELLKIYHQTKYKISGKALRRVTLNLLRQNAEESRVYSPEQIIENEKMIADFVSDVVKVSVGISGNILCGTLLFLGLERNMRFGYPPAVFEYLRRNIMSGRIRHEFVLASTLAILNRVDRSETSLQDINVFADHLISKLSNKSAVARLDEYVCVSLLKNLGNFEWHKQVPELTRCLEDRILSQDINKRYFPSLQVAVLENPFVSEKLAAYAASKMGSFIFRVGLSETKRRFLPMLVAVSDSLLLCARNPHAVRALKEHVDNLNIALFHRRNCLERHPHAIFNCYAVMQMARIGSMDPYLEMAPQLLKAVPLLSHERRVRCLNAISMSGLRNSPAFDALAKKFEETFVSDTDSIFKFVSTEEGLSPKKEWERVRQIRLSISSHLDYSKFQLDYIRNVAATVSSPEDHLLSKSVSAYFSGAIDDAAMGLNAYVAYLWNGIAHSPPITPERKAFLDNAVAKLNSCFRALDGLAGGIAISARTMDRIAVFCQFIKIYGVTERTLELPKSVRMENKWRSPGLDKLVEQNKCGSPTMFCGFVVGGVKDGKALLVNWREDFYLDVRKFNSQSKMRKSFMEKLQVPHTRMNDNVFPDDLTRLALANKKQPNL